jgi:hypothetical protein
MQRGRPTVNAKSLFIGAPFGLLWFAVGCRFADDRSLGSMAASPNQTDGGNTGLGTKVPGVNSAGTSAVSTSGGTSGNASGYGGACTRANPTCADGQFCSFDTSCGDGDSAGQCVVLSTNCPTPSGQQVVCGCNGVLYESLCIANASSVSATSLSRCPAIDCVTSTDCAIVAESCAAVFGATSPEVECVAARCDCQNGTILL